MPRGVLRLPIPTPFAVGAVNCYLVEDDPLTLVDCGPNSGTALVALEAALAEHGHRIEDLERIVLTHQHIDHVGLAGILAERSGAELCALEGLTTWIEEFDVRWGLEDEFAAELLTRHGIPADAVPALRSVSRIVHFWGGAARPQTALADGGTLGFAGRTWTVHHRPGHSPSDTVFHDEAAGELIAGDHLIKHISPNALVTLPLDGRRPEARPRSLMTYTASLRATRDMALSLVHPGHGDPIDDHVPLIDERFRMIERRVAKIAGLLADGPCTVYEIAQALWGGVAITQAYLTVSEVLGHLDILVDRGEALELAGDTHTTFALA